MCNLNSEADLASMLPEARCGLENKFVEHVVLAVRRSTGCRRSHFGFAFWRFEMARPLKLYNDALAPNPRRVRIFAAEKGIELSLEEVDILAGQSRTPEFLAKNSSGAVPVLELDDGSYLSESVAICRYLEGLQPEPNLLGRDLREQAEIERWNRRMSWNCSLPSDA